MPHSIGKIKIRCMRFKTTVRRKRWRVTNPNPCAVEQGKMEKGYVNKGAEKKCRVIGTAYRHGFKNKYVN